MWGTVAWTDSAVRRTTPGRVISIDGAQTDAMKHALAEVAKRERLTANMRAFVDETVAESGPLTEEEMEHARSFFR